ncbi:hypothetical protein FIBSPDRAFT_952015 [Athelia psychrophila]|uniref:DUF6533 domain-containing protein n=1 Tax=Athelia psychrophila TaxID=1759441 RepID=A0A166LZU1_9AGAM|nr:hypothetical protein FIBSPDRAFT_952015 [Fibularhizoctonia sp. CBS 109695]
MSELPVDLQTQLDINYFTGLISFAVLYYDYVLTFGDEVERFWNRNNFTWASLFFFMNRYLVVLGNIPVMFQSFWARRDLSDKNLIIVGILLIARVYAMYGRSRWIVILFLIIAVITITLGCWSVLTIPDPRTVDSMVFYDGCHGALDQKQGARLALAWIGQLCFDALVFVLTLYKSFVIRRSKNKTLVGTLLRDGTLYFAVMTAVNLGNILTFVTAPPLTKGAASIFTNTISATMMSRLMLNLRNPKMAGLYSGRTPELGAEEATTLPVVTSVFEHCSIVPTTKDDELERDLCVPRPGEPESAISMALTL